MRGRRWLRLGIVLVSISVLVLVGGTVFPSNNVGIALGWSQFAPLTVGVGGAACMIVGLLRPLMPTGGLRFDRRIIAISAILGAGLAAVFGAAGIAGQLPDWVSGANGTFLPGPSAGDGTFILLAAGLVTGAAIGGAVAAMRWFAHRGSSATPVLDKKS